MDTPRKFELTPVNLVLLFLGLAGGGGLGTFASSKDTTAELGQTRRDILDSVGKVQIALKGIETKLEGHSARAARQEKRIDDLKARLRALEGLEARLRAVERAVERERK